MKLRYILIPIFAALTTLGYAAEEMSRQGESNRVILDKVIAVVGNSSVLLSDLNQQVTNIKKSQLSEGYTSDQSVEAEALETLMLQKLLYSQALIDSVEINHMDIATRVEQQISYMRESVGGLLELEKMYNMEIYNIREILTKKMEEQSYAQAMRGTVTEDVTIVPGEVEAYYKSHDRDSLPNIGEQLRYAHITRFPSSIDDAKRRVRERLLDMRSKIISGEARFTSLAQMYSEDPGSSYRGGEMEPQESSRFVEEFAEALEMLKPGQVSEVVETEFGFHIIELIDQKGRLYHCRHILLKPVYTTEELMEPINFLDSLAVEIRRDSITFERAAALYSDDATSKMNGGIVSNHDILERYGAYDAARLTETKFLKEDFGDSGYKSLEDYTALSNLKEGEISDAYATSDLIGNKISKIVKLVEVYPAHKASLDEDYLELEEMALTDKKSEIFKKWLNNCIRTTYVFIDPEYRGLDFEYDNWVK